MGHDELQLLLGFFKALADESRLRILGILATRSCTVEELSELLQLKGPTVSHHLARLRALGLVAMSPEGNTHHYHLRSEALHDLSRQLLDGDRLKSLADDVEGEAWERKVLKDFFVGETLKEIPASRKKREVILRWLVGRFEPELDYPESRVNEVLKRHHPDFATLRRELIGHGLMTRAQGIYRRTAP